MKNNLYPLQKEIAVIMPSSHPEGGEATQLITRKGEKLLDTRGHQWILRRLAFLHSVDLYAARLNYGSLLGCKRYIPVPLNDNLVYVPLAVKATTLQERRLGYISLVEIETVEKTGDAVVVTLKSGVTVECIDALHTVEKRITQGKLVREIRRGKSPSGNGSLLDPLFPALKTEKRDGDEEDSFHRFARFFAEILRVMQ